jgi:hypothetical protein
MQAGTDWEDDLAYALKQADHLKQAACMVRWINITQLRPPRKYQQ